MDFNLPDEEENLRAELRRFLYDEVLPLEKSRNANLDNGFPRGVIDEVRKRSVELGFYGIEMPKRYGGKEIGLLIMCLLEEEIGRSGANLGYFILGNLGGPGRGGLLFEHCTEDQINRYIKPIMKAEKTCCFALTEPGAGSDAGNIQTTAVRQNDIFLINGTKTYITYGPYADVIILIAMTDKELGVRGGATAFFIDKATPGLKVAEIQNMVSMAGANMEATLTFENCVVPVTNVIGEIGKGLVLGMSRISRNRIRMSSLCVGIADRLLTLSIDYAKRRVQFGKPIAERESIQTMLADMATELYAARAMIYNAAWMVDQGVDARKEASMTKLFASELVGRVADKAVQIHGGSGLRVGHPVEKLYRSVRAFRIGTGTSEIQRATIAKALLRNEN